MIHVSNLGMNFGEKVLFEGVNLNLTPGNSYGLVGANGSGKSTFIKMIDETSDIVPEKGELIIPAGIKLGILKQDHFEYEDVSIINVVLMGKTLLWSAMEEKEKIFAMEEMDNEAGTRLGELEMIVADEDGYQAESVAADLLDGLGIPTEQHLNPLSSLSGGYKLRVLLAQCLFSEPDVLLLDEPTNHLDILSIGWLADYLNDFKGTILVISHDHHFLNQVTTHILDVDYETIISYKGNYNQFLAAKELEREQKETEIVRQEKKRDDLQQFVDRFKAKASKAKQAQSRMKMLEKLPDLQIKRSSRVFPNFRFQTKRPSGKRALEVKNLHKSFDDKKVLQNVSFEVTRGERIGVIGPNGVGKSTLLKILLDQYKASQGSFEWGHEVSISYFAQDHKEAIPPDSTPYEWLYGFAPGETIGAIRSLLGMMLFSGDDVHKATGTLSGGEAARLIFAKILLEKSNLLIIDEPTNHMDLEAIEALGDALVKYEGTVLFVSHDRYFVEKVASRILELKVDGYESFDGGYKEFLEWNKDDHLDRDSSLKKASTQAKQNKKEEKKVQVSNQDRQKIQKEKSKFERALKKSESKIADLEKKTEEIKSKFNNDTTLYHKENKKKLSELTTQQTEYENQISNEMEKWEETQLKLEGMNVL
ncbi:MAG: ATPase subunit of ABC transporter with duplicated ATPase domains [bacterium]|jgi:ATPase subunit of ABC transporter with duplicated ATPase domains